jgi:putative holliday junction resolvase
VSHRYLGVDLGTRRIGLALADSGTGVVSPLKLLQARPTPGNNAAAIVEVAEEYDAGAIIIGLPLNMDGTEGPQAALSRSLEQAVRNLLDERGVRTSAGQPLSVHVHDERLTSHAADKRLVDRDLTRKKKKARHDAVAAQILLESYLASKGPARD